MPKITSLQDLLIEELRDLYSAETQLTKALPQMAKAATNEELKEGFTEHLEQTKGHLERLEKALSILGGNPKGKKCKAMEGLIAEGKETIEEDLPPALKDSALIVAAQKVEHYEISGYGSLHAWAEALGLDDVAELLQETLDEESETDDKLTEIAETITTEAQDAESVAAGTEEDEE